MSENIASSITVGITVSLVAALVATILSLMVISMSIMSSGVTSLQSGVEQVKVQQFKVYDQTKISGTQLVSAMSQFSGQDIAILVQTKSLRNNYDDTTYINYNTLLAGAACGNTLACDTVSQSYANHIGNGTTDLNNIYWIYPNFTATKLSGNSFYTCNLVLESGTTVSAGSHPGTGAKGNVQYILESAYFRAELIKDASESIVGIAFKQID